MTDMPDSQLLKTPLCDRHVSMGAKMVPFGGWQMPLEYSGITEEHLAVRHTAGLFDVSHMGEIEIAGSDSFDLVQRLLTNDARRLEVGQAQYSALATAEGTVVDDLLLYRLGDDHFKLVVNAANVGADFSWIQELATDAGDVFVVNTSSRYALIAVQGPLALEIVQPLTEVELASVRYYRFATGEVAGVRATLSRTGYTGEDGFEIFVPPSAAVRLWDALLTAGKSAGLKPCGLGARDTLRLEAAMRLYGQDIDRTTTLLEAGLGWIVGWEKQSFIGQQALVQQREVGVTRKLVGLEMVERGIARHGYPVVSGGDQVGVVTSGTRTPSVKKSISLAYVPSDRSALGTEYSVDARGRLLRAKVVSLPFYKR